MKFRESQVAEIGGILKTLPIEVQNRFKGNLENDKHDFQAYNELLVCQYLRSLGLDPEYEKELCGKTPDWYVAPQNGNPGIAFEVVSDNPPEEYDKLRRAERDLCERIRKIPCDSGVALSLEIEDGVQLDQSENKSIAKNGERWLEENICRVVEEGQTDDFIWMRKGENTFSPKAGIEISFDGFSDIYKKYGHVQVFEPIHAERVKPKPLNEKILDKYGKYKTLADEGVALVVCPFLNFVTGRDEDDFERIEVFTNRPALSAVVLFQRDSSSPPVKTFHNPNVKYSLSGLLGRDFRENPAISAGDRLSPP